MAEQADKTMNQKLEGHISRSSASIKSGADKVEYEPAVLTMKTAKTAKTSDANAELILAEEESKKRMSIKLSSEGGNDEEAF